MTFRGKEWNNEGNFHWLVGTTIRIYSWNSGKNANFAIEASKPGYRQNFYKSIPGKGPEARDAAIELAMSLRDEYRRA